MLGSGLPSDSVALPGSRSDSPSEQSELMRRPPRPRTEVGGELLGQQQSRLVSQCSGNSDWNLLNPPGDRRVNQLACRDTPPPPPPPTR